MNEKWMPGERGYAPEPPPTLGYLIGWLLSYAVCLACIYSDPGYPGIVAWIWHGITGEWAGWLIIPLTGAFYIAAWIVLLIVTLTAVGHACFRKPLAGILLLATVTVVFYHHDRTCVKAHNTVRNLIEWTGTSMPKELYLNRSHTWDRR